MHPDTKLAALLQTWSRPAPRYTSYPTALQFSDAFTPEDYRQRLQASTDGAPVSLYLHLPFCEARCFFCACNTTISPDHAKVAWYIDALIEEIERVHSLLGAPRPAAQIHLGGGTPTYFEPEQLDRILTALRQRFPTLPDAELSVEVDPRVTTTAHLRALAAHGFNRISLGVQDLDPAVQRAIRRIQPNDLNLHIVREARILGFRSVNVDLIYGLPHQSADSFADTLQHVLELRPNRLAIYNFAYLPHLKSHHKRIDPLHLPGPDERLAINERARALLTEAGYIDIGMDHYALPDDELSSAQHQGTLARNFMGYTIAHTAETLAFGVSAIGFLGGAYIQNHHKLSAWRDDLQRGDLPVSRGLALDHDDLQRKHAIDELMCNFRIDRARFHAAWGRDLLDAFPEAAPRLHRLQDDGLLTLDPDALALTPTGRLFIRNIAQTFDRHNPPDEAQTTQRFSNAI